MTARVLPRPARRTPQAEPRERILAAATDLFYRDGINATGVERLAEQASVSKRTLYKYFPTKTAIVEGYLDGLTGYLDHRAAGDGDARERLLAIFDFRTRGRLRGCPFHNAAVEAADDMPGVQSLVNKYKRQSIDNLEELAAAAGAEEPATLARQLAVLFEGAMALATSLNDAGPVDDARSAAETLIDAAVHSRPARRRRTEP